MSQQLLKSFIVEIVQQQLNEITARTGPRTGGFEFDSAVKNRIYLQAVKAKQELQAKAKEQTDKIFRIELDRMSRFKIKDPVTGEYVYIFFQFFLDTNKKAPTGWYDPATNIIGLNVVDLDYDLWFKSSIPHELTHFFNIKHFKADLTTDDEDFEKYALQPHEKSAFLGGTLVSAMEMEAEKIAKEIKSKSQVAKKLGENLAAKPYRLYERLRNQKIFSRLINIYMKDPQLLRSLNKAAYDITQKNIVPALQELHLPLITSGMKGLAKEIAKEITAGGPEMKESDLAFANKIIKYPWLLYKTWIKSQEKTDDSKSTLDFYAGIPNSLLATKVNSIAQDIATTIIKPALYLSKL
jgi:hypothetical protein